MIAMPMLLDVAIINRTERVWQDLRENNAEIVKSYRGAASTNSLFLT
jgi:hypothetical protein